MGHGIQSSCRSTYICVHKRTRGYLNHSFFRTTIMQIPDEYNWEKLKCVLQYVRQKINIILILRIDSLPFIKLWVGALYASHPDMRGKTGATMSLGRGSVTGIVKKQKIDANISTKAELIGTKNAMPQMLCTWYFPGARLHCWKKCPVPKQHKHYVTWAHKDDVQK